MNAEFMPRMIGQDLDNHQKIHDLYEKLVDLCTTLKWDAGNVYANDELPIETFFEILRMRRSDLEIFLKQQHIIAQKISIPGINNEELAQSKLLQIPQEIGIVLDERKLIDEVIDQIVTTHFEYPVSKMYAEKESQFVLNEDFENELYKFTTTFTENEKQNEILTTVQLFCETVNDLIDLGIVNSLGNIWTSVGSTLQLAITNHKGTERPLSPALKMFQRLPLNRFGNKKPFEPFRQNRVAITS